MNTKSIKYIRNYIVGSVILVFIYISIRNGTSPKDLMAIVLKVTIVPFILTILLDPLLFLFKSKSVNRKEEKTLKQEWKDNFIENVFAYWIIWNSVILLFTLIRVL